MMATAIKGLKPMPVPVKRPVLTRGENLQKLVERATAIREMADLILAVKFKIRIPDNPQ
jgi:hypothetical protein